MSTSRPAPPVMRSRPARSLARRLLSHGTLSVVLGLALVGAAGRASADINDRIRQLAADERGSLLDTLKTLVHLESDSRDIEGLDRLAAVLATRLRDLGAAVETIEPGSAASPTIYRMSDTPPRVGKMVKATLRGTGKARILLIAHMDTVYSRGMIEREPFRLDGDRAYGLGIADDKQGIAVILHALVMLKRLDYRGWGQLTVLINGDEEISSPGSRTLIRELAGQHDVVMSFEGASARVDRLSLATAGIGAVQLKVTGRASHAGAAPDQGINALYELSHQILQMRDLSDPARGIRLNWTIAQAGSHRNVTPAEATASADVRVLREADFDEIEARVRTRMSRQLIPEAQVTMTFERRRPAMRPTPASQALARRAQAIYRELGLTLGADDQVAGGGTDAAFAAQDNPATAVVERFGLQGHGAHSADAEYVLTASIEPRLYLVTRLVMDVSDRLPVAAPSPSPAAPR